MIFIFLMWFLMMIAMMLPTAIPFIMIFDKISNERIFNELEKIMMLKNVYSLFSHELSKEIILNIFPQLKYYERLKIINSLNKKLRDMDYRDLYRYDPYPTAYNSTVQGKKLNRRMYKEYKFF